MAFMTFSVFGQVVLTEDFEDGNASQRWIIAEQGASNVVDMAFDYVGAGIAAAPNGGGKGMKITVNTNEATPEASQVLAFPMDKTFTGQYSLTCDVWLNFVGDAGTTEFALFGVKHTDQAAPNNTGVEFIFTGDNGSARDIRAYVNGTELLADNGEGGYGDPTTQSTEGEPYLSSYEGTVPGNQWLSVEVLVSTDSIKFKVNDIVWSGIPTITNDGNIVIGYADFFTSVAPDASAGNFGVFDNIKVTQIETTNVDRLVAKGVSIYPNPASEYLNVVVKERSSFELINAVGQVVLSREVEGTSVVELSTVTQGMYFAKVTAQNGQVEIQKVLVR